MFIVLRSASFLRDFPCSFQLVGIVDWATSIGPRARHERRGTPSTLACAPAIALVLAHVCVSSTTPATDNALRFPAALKAKLQTIPRPIYCRESTGSSVKSTALCQILPPWLIDDIYKPFVYTSHVTTTRHHFSMTSFGSPFVCATPSTLHLKTEYSAHAAALSFTQASVTRIPDLPLAWANLAR